MNATITKAKEILESIKSTDKENSLDYKTAITQAKVTLSMLLKMKELKLIKDDSTDATIEELQAFINA